MNIQQLAVPNETVKHIIDWTSVGTAVGAVLGWMPNLAACAAFVWTVLRVYYMIQDRRAGKTNGPE